MYGDSQLRDECCGEREISQEAILVVYGKINEYRNWIFGIIFDFMRIYIRFECFGFQVSGLRENCLCYKMFKNFCGNNYIVI